MNRVEASGGYDMMMTRSKQSRRRTYLSCLTLVVVGVHATCVIFTGGADFMKVFKSQVKYLFTSFIEWERGWTYVPAFMKNLHPT